MENGFGSRVKEFFLSLRITIGGWFNGFRLQPGWERGAIVGVGIVVVITSGYYGYISHSGFGTAVDIAVSAIIGVIGYILFLYITNFLLRLLLKLPTIFWVAAGLGILAGFQIWGDRTWLHWVFNAGLVLAAALIGIVAREVRRGDWEYDLIRKKIFLVVMLAVSVVAVIWFAVIFFLPGREAQPLPVQITLRTSRISAQDPSAYGSYQIDILTYGSGTDLRRPTYGENVDLRTEPVDASSFVGYDGLEEKAREFFWGFGVDQLPLNGRVWYPEGEGPFPLVLIVHGNHNQADYSDGGYRYLGELLASRGMIFVSVDENFLNGGLWGDSSGENDARAWLLLKHLEVWEAWNLDPDNPFFGMVDFDKIALIGHSRGGEAAALAATFNRVTRNPNSAQVTWDFGFNIRSVVAIAPVDEQWKPAGHSNPLVDINYLVLHGSHDADVYYFDGIQQYNRVVFTDPAINVFKAAVYIYRANHGQFNSSWGVRDSIGIKGQFLNRKALLSEEDQQQIAKLFISAFLEATLKGQDTYREIFKDYRKAGKWLPQTGYITQYEDYGMHLVADFEEDVDLTSCSLPGCKISTKRIIRWREEAPRFRNKDRQDNHIVRVGWSSNEASYSLNLARVERELSPDSILVFKAADARKPEDATEGLDFSIVLVDFFGSEARVKLSDVLPLQTQFPAEISRLPVWNEAYFKEPSEEVFQSFRLPLGLFSEDSDINLHAIKEIRFEFDQTGSGLVYLDEIGFDLLP